MGGQTPPNPPRKLTLLILTLKPNRYVLLVNKGVKQSLKN